MKLGILDQSPVISGKTLYDALQESMELAKWGEQLGYSRYWIAEHHDFPGLACPAPEVMLGFIGTHTSTIRIGAGAILLPHYKPYKVAETFNLLATLFPGRIDLGIGRAPGGSAEVTEALSGQFLQQVWKMPESLQELLHFLHQDFPQDHIFSQTKASPIPSIPPHTWLLGTSEKSAKLAAEQGTAYAFGHFMSEKSGPDIMKHYREYFIPRRQQTSESIVAISVICADTYERAEELALCGHLWSIQHGKGEGQKGIPSVKEAKSYPYSDEEKQMIESLKKKLIVGNPKQVREKLEEIQDMYQADEIMIVTITHSYEDRKRSYELIAKECLRVTE